MQIKTRGECEVYFLDIRGYFEMSVLRYLGLTLILMIHCRCNFLILPLSSSKNKILLYFLDYKTELFPFQNSRKKSRSIL